jgi:hypothetical protein
LTLCTVSLKLPTRLERRLRLSSTPNGRGRQVHARRFEGAITIARLVEATPPTGEGLSQLIINSAGRWTSPHRISCVVPDAGWHFRGAE